MLDKFLQKISNSTPQQLAEQYLFEGSVHVMSENKDYEKYLALIKNDYQNAQHIAIMGSANWGVSLNPRKNLKLFDETSDIDVAIVCIDSFNRTWEELRKYHRENYYLVPYEQKEKLKRIGENVYSGFICPKWIPNRNAKCFFEYEINTNNYSNRAVAFKKVNMMYFKNIDEVIDYYIWGFKAARPK